MSEQRITTADTPHSLGLDRKAESRNPNCLLATELEDIKVGTRLIMYDLKYGLLSRFEVVAIPPYCGFDRTLTYKTETNIERTRPMYELGIVEKQDPYTAPNRWHPTTVCVVDTPESRADFIIWLAHQRTKVARRAVDALLSRHPETAEVVDVEVVDGGVVVRTVDNVVHAAMPTRLR